VIPRPAALGHLVMYRDTDQLVKVVTGVRRCGKSTLLGMLKDHLLSQGVPAENVFALNFEDFGLADVDTAEKLHDLVTAHSFGAGRRYLLFDEIQLVAQWEKVINSLRLDSRHDIYITGSNLGLLGSQLATLLSGRYVRLDTFPLSFAEYLQARPENPQVSRRQRFMEYLSGGGLPGLSNLPDDAQVVREYLDGVLSTIVLKDVAAVHDVRDVDALQKVIRYLAANVGHHVTAAGIAHYLVSSGRRISADTVDNYLRLLEDAFLFYRARRLDLRSKAAMKTNDKFYLVDLGFRSLLLGPGVTDIGRLLENVVYFELRRRGHSVSVGQHGAQEVDFVATGPDGGPHYYQVTLSLLDPTTAARELAPLRAIRDHYPKTVLSLDDIASRDYDGIAHQNLLDFLL